MSVALGTAVALAAPAAAGSETIVAAWQDVDGNTILLREGTWNGKKGFGWKKIQAKHKIRRVESVRFVTLNPAGGQPQGNDRVYMAYANKKVCDGGYCRYTESLPVRAVVNFFHTESWHGATVNGVLGVKTTYCINEDGATDCPSWVDEAFAKPASNAGRIGDAGEAVLSYHPLMNRAA